MTTRKVQSMPIRQVVASLIRLSLISSGSFAPTLVSDTMVSAPVPKFVAAAKLGRSVSAWVDDQAPARRARASPSATRIRTTNRCSPRWVSRRDCNVDLMMADIIAIGVMN